MGRLWNVCALCVRLGRPSKKNQPMATDSFGIDTSKLYFREEICQLWGYAQSAEEVEIDPRQASDNLRRWFKRHFRDKGLKTFTTGGREAVHGKILAAWVDYQSAIQSE